MSTTPTTNSFKFHVLPEDSPQRLHDALDQITKKNGFLENTFQ